MQWHSLLPALLLSAGSVVAATDWGERDASATDMDDYSDVDFDCLVERRVRRYRSACPGAGNGHSGGCRDWRPRYSAAAEPLNTSGRRQDRLPPPIETRTDGTLSTCTRLGITRPVKNADCAETPENKLDTLPDYPYTARVVRVRVTAVGFRAGRGKSGHRKATRPVKAGDAGLPRPGGRPVQQKANRPRSPECG